MYSARLSAVSGCVARRVESSEIRLLRFGSRIYVTGRGTDGKSVSFGSGSRGNLQVRHLQQPKATCVFFLTTLLHSFHKHDDNKIMMLTAISMLLLTTAAQQASGLAVTAAVTGWTDVAIQAAETMTVHNKERLSKSGVLDVVRPIRIIAEPISSSSPQHIPGTKILHFQRHGQGYHNLLGDVCRGMDMKIDMDSTDPKLNPWINPAILDSPLTETGRQQCMARRPNASQLKPELLIVSPLLRAIQTAYITFADCSKTVPWVAHEGCREELGLLMCNKRRPLSQIEDDFPDIDFTLISDEQDDLFDAIGDRRETVLEKTDRIYDFLKYVRSRPEQEIAIVGHSSWLFYMLHAVMDCQDEQLGKWFLTSEVRSMRVTFCDDTKASSQVV